MSDLKILPCSHLNKVIQILLEKNPHDYVMFFRDADCAYVHYSESTEITTIIGALERAKFCLIHDSEHES